jgi:hypothetical protein
MNEQQRAVVQQALEAAYLAGFQATGEGYNAEYPFEGCNPEANVAWVRDRDNALRQLLEQPEPVPLTDEQADLLINGRGEHGDDDYVEPTGDGFGLTDGDLVKLIRRVEAHHGIGVKP